MTDPPRPFPLDEERPLIDRVRATERDLAVVQRLLGLSSKAEDADEDPAPTTPGLTDHKAPQLGLRHPTTWRGLPDDQVAARWEDLSAWVDWLIEAYRLPPRPWERWWMCPGACEELAALRAWHRELVDIALAAMLHAPDDLNEDEQIDWLRNERTVRLEIARSHVEWHEALWQVVARVAGVHVEQKALLAREVEATNRTTDLRDAELKRRGEAFAKWLIDPDSDSDGSDAGVEAPAATDGATVG